MLYPDETSNRGVGRMRRRGILVLGLVGAMLLLTAGSAVAEGGPNPFVGSWESIDPDPDNSHVRLQIGGTGNWHLRDEAASVCLNNGYGFVPASVRGTGEFTSADTYEAHAGDIYCHTRDGDGLQFVLTGPTVGYAYWPAADVIIDQFGICWWRSGTGEQSNCPAD